MRKLFENSYYPFGMIQPGRKYSAIGGYRYGFNGKENDNEVKGEGNTIGFENRIYDSRLGKWFSLDPLQKKYPNLTPYNFVANNPLIFIDVDGRKIILTGTQKDKKEFVAKLAKLTGFELDIQDGNIKILKDNGNPASKNLRDAVWDLLDEKGKKYDNDVVFKLVSKKSGFRSNRFDRKQISKNVFFDDFETGALDMDDLRKAKNDAVYATLLAHFIGERASLDNYKSYIDKLDTERPYDKKAKTLEKKGENQDIFDRAHVAGKILETNVLTDFFADFERMGKPVKLRLPSDMEYSEIQKTSTFTLKYGGIDISGTTDPKNTDKVKTVDINIADSSIKAKK